MPTYIHSRSISITVSKLTSLNYYKKYYVIIEKSKYWNCVKSIYPPHKTLNICIIIYIFYSYCAHTKLLSSFSNHPMADIKFYTRKLAMMNRRASSGISMLSGVIPWSSSASGRRYCRAIFIFSSTV